jgi:hypothetical protein
MITRDGPIVSIPCEHFHEGIWMNKRGGLYYLSYPMFENGLASKMVYSVGHSPLGPFEYKGVIIDNHSRNIHGSITSFEGKWYVFYHVQGPSPYERRVCMQEIHFNSDGTIQQLPDVYPPTDTRF